MGDTNPATICSQTSHTWDNTARTLHALIIRLHCCERLARSQSIHPGFTRLRFIAICRMQAQPQHETQHVQRSNHYTEDAPAVHLRRQAVAILQLAHGKNERISLRKRCASRWPSLYASLIFSDMIFCTRASPTLRVPLRQAEEEERARRRRSDFAFFSLQCVRSLIPSLFVVAHSFVILCASPHAWCCAMHFPFAFWHFLLLLCSQTSQGGRSAAEAQCIDLQLCSERA